MSLMRAGSLVVRAYSHVKIFYLEIGQNKDN